MQEQLIKMAAAALGITPEAVNETVSSMMQFVQTADARLNLIETQTADTWRMMKALYELDFPPSAEAVNQDEAPRTLLGIKADGGSSDSRDA